MANDHSLSTATAEQRARDLDAHAAYVAAGGLPTVPTTSLTLDAFATDGYVLDGVELTFVRQAAAALTFPAVNGVHWIAIDVSTFVSRAGWTRPTFGAHYLIQQSATKPAAIDGVEVFCQVVVAASIVSTVTPFAYRSPIDAKQRIHNVLNWGATGDGLTDDTTAIQAAVNALITSGDVLYFPSTGLTKFYNITVTITLPATSGITLRGSGDRASQIRQTTASADGFTTNTAATNAIAFENLYFDGNVKSARYGIVMGSTTGGANRSKIKGCRFNSWGTAGVILQNSIIVTITGNKFDNCKDGIFDLAGASVSAPNGIAVTGNQFEGNSDHGIRVTTAQGWNISGNVIEANLLGGIRIDAGIGIEIAGNYWEGNSTTGGGGAYFDIYLGQTGTAYGISITGNFFLGQVLGGGDTEDYYPIRAKLLDGVIIDANAVSLGSRFFDSDNSSLFIDTHMHRTGFVNGSLALSGNEQSYQNLPSTFYEQALRNSIGQISHIDTGIHQDLARHGSLRLDAGAVTASTSGSGWTVAVTNGTVVPDGQGFLLDTTSTASRDALARTEAAVSRGLIRNHTNYLKEHIWTFTIEQLNGTTNGEAWFLVEVDTAAADPTSAGFGFKLDNAALRGLTHTGSALTEVDLSTTLIANDVYVLRVEKAGSAITWFVNGVSVGTSVNVPTTTDAVCNVLFAVANNADSAQQRVAILAVEYRVAQ